MESSSDGRARPAAETYALIEPHFARLGVSRVARQTGLDRIGIPCFAAIRPNSRTLAAHYGKGLSDIAAKTAAVMEAVEFAIAEAPTVQRRVASLAELELEGLRTVACDRLLPPGQMLDTDLGLVWAEGQRLGDKEAVWVPLEAVSIGDAEPVMTGIARSTNGLASGNTRDEAILHGLCELIERDAMTLWSFRSDASAMTTAIAPADFGDPVVDELAGRIERADLDLRLFDVTTDLGIPVVHAIISERSPGRRRLFDLAAGSACHPSSARAAISAITEAAQSRLTNIAGSRDDYSPHEYGLAADEGLISLVRKPGLYGPVPTSMADRDSAADRIDLILDTLNACDIGDVAAVDLGGTDMGIAVVRVLIPRLEDNLANVNWRPGPRSLRAMMGAA